MSIGPAISRTPPDAGGQSRIDVPSVPRGIIVFLHVAGGAGATTLAVNTAYSLKPVRANRGCCLLDLDVQFGAAARLLDLPPSSGLEVLLENPQVVENGLFERVLVTHRSGLQVLTAPRVPVPLQALKRAVVTNLINSCCARFTTVVIDLPVAITTWTNAVLMAATTIYLVTPLSIPSAYAVRSLIAVLAQHGLGNLPIDVVVTRKPARQAKHAVTPEKFCEAIARPIRFVIPDEFELIERSHNEGIPAVELAPKSRFARVIAEMGIHGSRGRPNKEPGTLIGETLSWWKYDV